MTESNFFPKSQTLTLRQVAEMAQTTLEDLGQAVGRKAPATFGEDVERWLDGRVEERERARLAAMRDGARRRSMER